MLAEVFEEVFFEVWRVLRALSPLQGAWLRLGLVPIVTALLEAWTWDVGQERPRAILRERWPSLVPGTSALDCLAHLMVDAICA